MSGAARLLTIGMGCIAFALALPVAAQDQACPAGQASIGEGTITGFADGLPRPPCQEPSLPPARPKPLIAKSSELPPEVGEPVKPEFRVASTDLGFEQGIGPAPGYAVAFQGKRYVVIDIKTADGSPFFSGGSRFVVGVKGAKLEVGLAVLGNDKAYSSDERTANVVN